MVRDLLNCTAMRAWLEYLHSISISSAGLTFNSGYQMRNEKQAQNIHFEAVFVIVTKIESNLW